MYRGTVWHERRIPFVHRFRYRLFMVYLDLAELPDLFAGNWLWSAERFNVASYRRYDHYGDPQQPLEKAIRDLVQEQLGFRPAGPIRLLTNLRYWGYAMNPVSFYYCFDEAEHPVAFVAEVSNTPWGEQHCYVIPWSAAADAACDQLQAEHPKEFHVSPFLPMEMQYAWQVTCPADRLRVNIDNHSAEGQPFSAGMDLQRVEWSSPNLRRTLLLHPWMTGKIVAGIYWQALKLWLKGAVYHPHP